MAGKRLEYDISVDSSKGVQGIRQFSRAATTALDDVSGALDDTSTKGEKVAQVLSQMAGEIKTQLAGASTAADALSQALGPELTSRANVGQIVADLHAMGLTFDEITADADKLGLSLKELDSAQMGGLEKGLAVSKGGVDELGKSAGSSKSALANMIGNSAQDLGQVGGIAGTTGVAIGQMAEYMADAAFEGEGLGSVLKSFAAVAGPIAALSLIVGTVTNLIGKQQAEAEAAAARTKEFGDAMSGSTDDAVGLTGALRDNVDQLTKFDAEAEGFGSSIVEGLTDVGRAVPVLGSLVGSSGQDLNDLTTVMDKAGLSMFDLGKAIDAGGKLFAGPWSQQLLDAVNTGKITESEFGAISDAIHTYGEEADKAKQIQKLFNVNAEEANAILGDIATQAEPMSKFGDIWARLFTDLQDGTVDTQDAADAVNELAAKLGISREEVLKLAQANLSDNMAKAAEETQKATEAQDEFNQTVASTDFGGARLQGALTGMTQFHDVFFALPEIASANEKAFDDLGASLKENGNNWDLNTQKGRDNQTALEDVASTIDLQLADAFNKAKGNFKTFQTSAQNISNTLSTRLQKELGLSKDDADAMIQKLGLMPKDIETRYKMSGTEEARVKIGLLQTSIDNLPKDVQAKVTQQIIAGDYVGAVNTVQSYFSNHPGKLATEVQDPHSSDLAGAVGFATSFFNNNPAHMRVVPNVPPVYDQGGTAPAGGGIAGEKGTEILNGRWLTSGPTLVPPGTKVTSRRQTARILRHRGTAGLKYYDKGGTVPFPATVVIQAGVIGNRFDVQRAVTKALRGHQRLNGMRP